MSAFARLTVTRIKIWVTLTAVRRISIGFKDWVLRITEQNGAGDGIRTHSLQLGKLNFRSFIFNTYKIAKKKYACMRCIPCMPCLKCVSLRDVCGTVCHQGGKHINPFVPQAKC